MSRLFLLIFALLHPPTSVLSRPGNLYTVSSPVEVLRSPVTKVETINFTPTVTRVSAPSASAYAVASTSSLPVSRIESYSSGDSSNGEIRDLLRSLLSELRSGGGRPTTSTVTLSAPSSSYSTVGDSYSAPPRNTVTDLNAPTYPDSISIARKPEKVQVQQVIVQEEQRQSTPVVAVSAVSSVSSLPAVREVVRTVYQPVYVPVQVSQPEIYTQSAPVVSAVPTTIRTGASAVAFATIHEQPAYAIQQQQPTYTIQQQPTYAIQQQIPVVQQVQQIQQFAVSSGGYQETAVLEGGYNKKK